MVQVEAELFEKLLLGLIEKNLADDEVQIISDIGLSEGVFGQVSDRGQRAGEFSFEEVVGDGSAFEAGPDEVADGKSAELLFGGDAIARQEGGVCGLGCPFCEKVLDPLGDEVLVFEVYTKTVAEVPAEGFFVGQVGEGLDAMGLLVDSDLGSDVAFALVVVEQFEQLFWQGVNEISADTMSAARDGVEVHSVGGDFLMTSEDGLFGLERSRVGMVLAVGNGIIASGDPAKQTAVHECAVDEEIEGFEGHENTDSGDRVAFNIDRVPRASPKSNWLNALGAVRCFTADPGTAPTEAVVKIG